MIYSYTRNINGFAAILDEKQAAQIAGNLLKRNDIYSFIFFNNFRNSTSLPFILIVLWKMLMSVTFFKDFR